MDTQSVSKSPEPKIQRPPPITINNDHWAAAAPKIMQNYDEYQLTAKFTNNSIKLFPADPTIYREIQDLLGKEKIAFHTYGLKEDRVLKVLLRGIPTFHTEELVSLNYNPPHVRQFIKNGIKLLMFTVTLPCNPESKNIFNLSTFFYVKIRVEAYRNSGPAQCYNCQGFGHSSAHCGHPPKCVKCGKNHLSNNCNKSVDQPPTCCNCGGEHTASFKKCPSYILSSTQKKAKPTDLTPMQIPYVQNLNKTDQISFAQILSNNINPQTHANNNFSSDEKNNLVEILNKTITQIQTSTDFKQAIILVLSALASLVNHG